MSACGYTVIDRDGDEQPCDRPATGWRWYQGHDHEDVLEPACWEHENPGGNRMRAAEAKVAAVEALVEYWLAHDMDQNMSTLLTYREAADVASSALLLALDADAE